MPVNTAALKTFAPAMRRHLLEAVGRKLDLLLNSQTPDTLSTYAKQIAELREQEAENREQLVERVAYTWFNRLCALRYLDARGWHPFGCKVLMPAAVGETQPELLKLMRAGNLPADLQSHTDPGRLHGLLDGQIQTAIAGADPQSEVYRQLVLAVCRCYHELLPNLFEGLDDASELLLPGDLLSDGSIVGAFRKEITDDDCQDVESLGWLYQFYIAEKKDEVMARKKAVPTEDIPAVTQLFTPHWIVRYLVENSLGRLWLLNRPGSKLRDQMPYYIEGDAETDFLVINKPEEIKLLDPACGSGHMLTYAFDLLVLIYEEEGYSPNEIPGLILKHNLHGLEICPRAAQLAELALVFKAREQSRRFFQPEQLVRPQIIELQDVQFEDGELNDYIEALDLGELFDPNLFKLLHQFEEAKNFGSLIQPCLHERAIANVRRTIEVKELSGHLFLRETHLKVLRVLEQSEALAQRYHVAIGNPPYMGSGGMNPSLKSFLSAKYPASKLDTMTAFMERAVNLTVARGWWGIINLPSWMFLGSFASLRKSFLRRASIQSLIHLGRGIFGADFGSVAFVVKSSPHKPGHSAVFRRLFKQHSIVRSPGEIEADFLDESVEEYTISQDAFLKIHGSPLTYWYSAHALKSLTGPSVTRIATPMIGIQSGDNLRFYRFWWEADFNGIDFEVSSLSDLSSRKAWVPLQRGGDARKWYGNNEYIVNLSNAGEEILATTNGSLRNSSHYFKECASWNRLSNGRFFVRFVSKGFAFDDVSPFAVAEGATSAMETLSLLGSKPGSFFVKAFSTGYKIEVGHVGAIPLPGQPIAKDLLPLMKLIVGIARTDWDNFEASWDFRGQPLLSPVLNASTLKTSWRDWETWCTATILRMQELEVENNQFFITAYGLERDLQPDVPEEQITLARADPRKDIAAFLSYATGCMMGRYSLDHPGLILANSRNTQAEQLADYETKVGKPLSEVQFKPDPDGIIPVLDGEWFEDDIVARTREFLAVTFPESTVTENLRFIEESLGKDIRKYFCSEFYKDHLQTYKKRPIYWMVQSPKKGFGCLIYLHRYTKDTLNQVLNYYFRPYLKKLESRLEQLGRNQLDQDLKPSERTAARKEADKITKVIKECQAWEQDALLPLAQQRIELDLDDGVKVNYLKLQDVLAPIPGLAAKED